MTQVQVAVSLTAFGFAPRPATAVVIEQSTGERVARVFTGLGMFWALALGGLFIPVAHFILVPTFLTAGIIMAVKRSREDRRLAEVRGPCPRCGAAADVQGRRPLRGGPEPRLPRLPRHVRAGRPGAGLMSERWAMLLVIFFTRTALGFQFQSIAALTPFLVTAFDISWAQVGLLMGLFMLPGVVFALPGGLLGQRFGSQRVVFAGLGLMIAGGMLVSYAGGFGSAALGRTLSGIGGVLVNIMLARMVADWFRGRELQTALGLMLAAWPFGMALALMMLGPLALLASWRVAEYATVVAAALALAVMALLYEDPPEGPGAARRRGCGSTCRGACGSWRSARASAGRCSTRASSWWRASRRAS